MKHPKLHEFLKDVSGVIHIGASTGQERDLYSPRKVLWVEPIPEVFRELQGNIISHPAQEALNALVAEKEGPQTLFVASNGGQSSSVYDLKDHRKLHSRIHYTGKIEMDAVTLDSIAPKEGYDALVLDTQGSELDILKGGEETLKRMKFVKVECWSIEAYRGIPMRPAIEDFLTQRGFSLIHEEEYYKGKGWDLVFEKS
jgi:FkbM family methyltransferase